MSARINHPELTGKQFGRLAVISILPRQIRTQELAMCACSCGATKPIPVRALLLGQTVSCGCKRREVPPEGLRFSHGMSRSQEYVIWSGMIARCTNRNLKNYHNYGGRGISVCDRWSDSFEAFYADMGPRPSPTHSLDRFPDKNGNYEPGNVRWATRAEQARNRRDNKLTESDAMRMKVLALAGFTHRSIACEFSVSLSTVFAVIHNRTWKQTTEAAQ